MDEKIYQVPALEHAIKMLQFLQSRHHRPWGVSELSRSLGLNKSTCFSILKTLERYGFVACDEATKKYALGSALIELGGAAAATATRSEITKPFLQDLFEELHLTCLLGHRFQDKVVIIDKVEAPDAFRITVPIGQVLPLSLGAMGKSFLAYMREAEIDRVITAEAGEEAEGRRLRKYLRLKRELEEIRRRGFAESFGEIAKGVNAVAAPIFNHQGQVILALGAIGLHSALPPRRLARLGRKVKEVAGLIARAMGGRPAGIRSQGSGGKG
ncbi:MAG: IclR family transcriptional regulator [Candidatus Methylomirabilales bacterium]